MNLWEGSSAIHKNNLEAEWKSMCPQNGVLWLQSPAGSYQKKKNMGEKSSTNPACLPAWFKCDKLCVLQDQEYVRASHVKHVLHVVPAQQDTDLTNDTNRAVFQPPCNQCPWLDMTSFVDLHFTRSYRVDDDSRKYTMYGFLSRYRVIMTEEWMKIFQGHTSCEWLWDISSKTF